MLENKGSPPISRGALRDKPTCGKTNEQPRFARSVRSLLNFGIKYRQKVLSTPAKSDDSASCSALPLGSQGMVTGSVVMAVSFYSQSVGFGQRYSKGSIFGLIRLQDNRPIIHLHEALQKKVLRIALGSCAAQAERVMDRH